MSTIVDPVLHRNNNAMTALALALALALIFPHGSLAQSLLDRTPNITGGWTGAPGVVHFNFLHRFTRSPAPARKISSSPTFLLAYSPVERVLAGVTYVTSSDLAPNFPNEWEVLARYAPFDFVSVQAGYNNAAESFDVEIGAHHDVGRLRLLVAGRMMSSAFAEDSLRLAIAAGGVLRLNRWIALAGDVARPITLSDIEDMAWGGALQLAIPYTPHTLSLQATNTNTATLQGASRGSERVRYGFEFTIPLTLSRWFGDRDAAETAAVPSSATVVSMKSLRFTPERIVVAAGSTVVWRNDDPLAHTVTAEDGSWTSPLIQPGGAYQRTFDVAGEFAITCTPHPFMKSVVEVKP